MRGNLFAILLSLTAIVLTFLTTQRVGAIETVLMSGILTLSLWSYVSAEQRMRYKTPLFVGGLIFVGLFVWGFIYVGQLRGLQELQLTDLDNVFVEQLYIYFGGPAPRNFQMVLDGGVFSGSQSERYGALFFVQYYGSLASVMRSLLTILLKVPTMPRPCFTTMSILAS